MQGEEEKEIAAKLAKITEQYEFLVQKTTQKTARLKEANRQRLYYTAYKDFDFWLSEVTPVLLYSLKYQRMSTRDFILSHGILTSLDDKGGTCSGSVMFFFGILLESKAKDSVKWLIRIKSFCVGLFF